MPNTPSTYFSFLDKQYLPALRNLDVPHPHLMIWFSGPPSSGKSTVAKIITGKLGALYLENDEIRRLLVKHFPDLSFEERNELTYAYRDHICNLLVRKPVKNGLWVIDSGIEHSQDFFYPFAREHHFDHILIAMNIPESTHREWIIAGGDRPHSSTKDYLKRMPKRRQEQEQFIRTHQPDISLQPGYNIDDVLEAITARLQRQTDNSRVE